jgi:hypothetical protein
MENSENNLNENKIEIRRPINKKDYMKKYYFDNKQKMIIQTIEAKKIKRLSEDEKNKLLEKLNTNQFKRIPKKSLKKFNINFDENLKKYI